MTPPNASNDDIPPSPPPPPPSEQHHRQRSLRLSQAWVEADLAAINDNENENNDNDQRLIDVPTTVAFFPLPAEEDVAPPSPRSPRSKRVSVPGVTPGAVVELTLPDSLPLAIDNFLDLKEKTKAERRKERLAKSKESSSTIGGETDDQATDAADGESLGSYVWIAHVMWILMLFIYGTHPTGCCFFIVVPYISSRVRYEKRRKLL